MTVISNILYWISTGLLVPVIVLLIFFFIRSIILIGNFFGQYMSRRRAAALLDNKITNLEPADLVAFIDSLPAGKGMPVIACLKEIAGAAGNTARLDMLVTDYELTADNEISTSRILTTMGPMLGLMGTLIPMGPALVGLATGDIASMAYNMQVAFATTVVGLVVSAIGFVTRQAGERWALHNLMILDFAVQSLKEIES